MCPHIVDGRAHSAAGWAGELQSAARWSARSCGAHVGKRFRRRQRRAGLLSEGGTAPPTQRVICDPRGTRRHVEEWAGIASRLCAEPPLGARCPGRARNRVPATPTGACHTAHAPFLFFWASLQYGHLTAVKKSTCQIGPPSCGRDRAMTSSSAASLRGIPQCDGENMKFT
ncbi:mucin-associated surface protein (MASP) [Trypanosoma cruzi]|nr:mucin-associated surface protein (MASP) [Trypanosoma cruzi]